MIPAPAATAVLLDERSPPRIFFVRRHGAAAFMANAYVFPGGRVDPGDHDAARLVTGMDAAAMAARMEGVAGARDALAHVVCAARETFEEAGALVAKPRGGAWPDALGAAVLEEARLFVHDGTLSFAALLERWGLVLDGDAWVYFDHWITPPGERRRFDTRFFVTRAPAGPRYRHDGVETTASVWLTAAEALERHRRGGFGLAPPTFWILRQLAALGDLEGILAWAAARVVTPTRPAIEADGGRLLVSVGGGQARIVWRGDHWEAASG